MSQWGKWAHELDDVDLRHLTLAYVRRRQWEAQLLMGGNAADPAPARARPHVVNRSAGVPTGHISPAEFLAFGTRG